MVMRLKFGWMLAVTLMACCGTAGAQMVVHAVSGIVKAIDPHAKTMDVEVDTGGTSQFKLAANPKVALDFDNALRSDSVDPEKFEHVGDFVVVYYYGYDADRTAVALKDLGAGPFEKIEGTVVSFDKHARTMTVKDDSGKSAPFALSDHLIVDTGMSVASGRGFDPHKGWQVRVTYTNAGDKNTAVFVRSRE